MKKIYELEELSCPNCADILAKNLQKIDFIEEVHINYNTKQVEIISEKELTDNEVSLVMNTFNTYGPISYPIHSRLREQADRGTTYL
jgi:copper chaperone CopZ